MADTSGILKIALLGGAAWAAWEFFLKPSTPAISATPNTSASGVSPVVVPFNTPDQIYQRLVTNLNGNPQFKANPSGFTATPYQFKFYLDQVTQVPSGLDFSQLFPGQVNSDGSASATPNLTLGQFWSAMAPWLAKNIPGMTGFRGLAGIIARGRR
jgi:hypothetical protein